MLDPYGHPICSFCGAGLRIDEGLHICRQCAAAFPYLKEAEHPHREGRLEYKYPEGKRSEESARS